MVNTGEVFIAIKPIGRIVNVGDVCIVTKVEKNFVYFDLDSEDKFINGNYHMGIDDFLECFNKQDNKNEQLSFIDIIGNKVNDIIDNSEVIVDTVFDNCTIVAVRLPNGNVITESYYCPNIEDYDEDDGFKYCMNRIINKVWEFEEYRTQMNTYNCKAENYMDDNDCEVCSYYDKRYGSCGHED